MLDSVSRKFEGGVGPKGDVSQAATRLKFAQTTLMRYKKNLADSKAAYQSLIGEKPMYLIKPVVPFKSLDPELERKIKKAMRFSPYVRASIATAKGAR